MLLRGDWVRPNQARSGPLQLSDPAQSIDDLCALEGNARRLAG